MATIEVVPQNIEVRPAQVPENNCIRAPVKFAPVLLRLISAVALTALNLYHTSYPTGPVQGAIATAEAVAPTTVPLTLEHDPPSGRVIAFMHSSLEGGGGGGSVTQILKPALVADVGAVPAEA